MKLYLVLLLLWSSSSLQGQWQPRLQRAGLLQSMVEGLTGGGMLEVTGMYADKLISDLKNPAARQASLEQLSRQPIEIISAMSPADTKTIMYALVIQRDAQGELTHRLLARFDEAGVLSAELTYVAVRTALRRSAVAEALHLMREIGRRDGLVIDIESVEAVVALLCRNNLLEQAWEILTTFQRRSSRDWLMQESTYMTVIENAGRLGLSALMLDALATLAAGKITSGLRSSLEGLDAEGFFQTPDFDNVIHVARRTRRVPQEEVFITSLQHCAYSGDYPAAERVFDIYERVYGVVQQQAYPLLLVTYVSSLQGRAAAEQADRAEQLERAGRQEHIVAVGDADVDGGGSGAGDAAEDTIPIIIASPPTLRSAKLTSIINFIQASNLDAQPATFNLLLQALCLEGNVAEALTYLARMHRAKRVPGVASVQALTALALKADNPAIANMLVVLLRAHAYFPSPALVQLGLGAARAGPGPGAGVAAGTGVGTGVGAAAGTEAQVVAADGGPPSLADGAASADTAAAATAAPAPPFPAGSLAEQIFGPSSQSTSMPASSAPLQSSRRVRSVREKVPMLLREYQPQGRAMNGFYVDSSDKSLPCGCGSGESYRLCCDLHHATLGNPSNLYVLKEKLNSFDAGAVARVIAPSPLDLIRARYSAVKYALPDYLIGTAHPSSSDYVKYISESKASTKGSVARWRKDLLAFTGECRMLEILGIEYGHLVNGSFVAELQELGTNATFTSETAQRYSFCQVFTRVHVAEAGSTSKDPAQVLDETVLLARFRDEPLGDRTDAASAAKAPSGGKGFGRAKGGGGFGKTTDKADGTISTEGTAGAAGGERRPMPKEGTRWCHLRSYTRILGDVLAETQPPPPPSFKGRAIEEVAAVREYVKASRESLVKGVMVATGLWAGGNSTEGGGGEDREREDENEEQEREEREEERVEQEEGQNGDESGSWEVAKPNPDAPPAPPLAPLTAHTASPGHALPSITPEFIVSVLPPLYGQTQPAPQPPHTPSDAPPTLEEPLPPIPSDPPAFILALKTQLDREAFSLALRMVDTINLPEAEFGSPEGSGIGIGIGGGSGIGSGIDSAGSGGFGRSPPRRGRGSKWSWSEVEAAVDLLIEAVPYPVLRPHLVVMPADDPGFLGIRIGARQLDLTRLSLSPRFFHYLVDGVFHSYNTARFHALVRLLHRRRAVPAAASAQVHLYMETQQRRNEQPMNVVETFDAFYPNLDECPDVRAVSTLIRVLLRLPSVGGSSGKGITSTVSATPAASSSSAAAAAAGATSGAASTGAEISDEPLQASDPQPSHASQQPRPRRKTHPLGISFVKRLAPHLPALRAQHRSPTAIYGTLARMIKLATGGGDLTLAMSLFVLMPPGDRRYYPWIVSAMQCAEAGRADLGLRLLPCPVDHSDTNASTSSSSSTSSNMSVSMSPNNDGSIITTASTASTASAASTNTTSTPTSSSAPPPTHAAEIGTLPAEAVGYAIATLARGGAWVRALAYAPLLLACTSLHAKPVPWAFTYLLYAAAQGGQGPTATRVLDEAARYNCTPSELDYNLAVLAYLRSDFLAPAALEAATAAAAAAAAAAANTAGAGANTAGAFEAAFSTPSLRVGGDRPLGREAEGTTWAVETEPLAPSQVPHTPHAPHTPHTPKSPPNYAPSPGSPFRPRTPIEGFVSLLQRMSYDGLVYSLHNEAIVACQRAAAAIRAMEEGRGAEGRVRVELLQPLSQVQQQGLGQQQQNGDGPQAPAQPAIAPPATPAIAQSLPAPPPSTLADFPIPPSPLVAAQRRAMGKVSFLLGSLVPAAASVGDVSTLPSADSGFDYRVSSTEREREWEKENSEVDGRRYSGAYETALLTELDLCSHLDVLPTASFSAALERFDAACARARMEAAEAAASSAAAAGAAAGAAGVTCGASTGAPAAPSSSSDTNSPAEAETEGAPTILLEGWQQLWGGWPRGAEGPHSDGASPGVRRPSRGGGMRAALLRGHARDKRAAQ